MSPGEGDFIMFSRFVSVAAAGVLAACTHTRLPADALTDIGFDAVALPSTAYGPGLLVSSVRGEGMKPPLKLTYLCSPKYTQVPEPSVDVAASSEASRKFAGNFRLDGTAMNAIGVGAAAEYIQSLNVKLENVKVEQLGFDELLMVRDGLGPNCRKIVAEYASKGIAYQTKQALRADIAYTATFKAGVSAEAKGLAIASLKAVFGGSVSGEGGTTLKGNGLYYGLILHKI
jgi:hypothetical protein